MYLRWDSFDAEKINRGRFIVLLDIDTQSTLSSPTKREFLGLKALFTCASSIVWVSTGDDPDKSLVSGILRTMKTENPSLLSMILNFDIFSTDDIDAATFIVNQEARLFGRAHPALEAEYTQKDGIWNIGRIVPVEKQCEDTKQTLSTNGYDQVELQALGKLGPVNIDVLAPGLLSSIAFRSTSGRLSDELADDEVDIQVMAAGLNMIASHL